MQNVIHLIELNRLDSHLVTLYARIFQINHDSFSLKLKKEKWNVMSYLDFADDAKLR